NIFVGVFLQAVLNNAVDKITWRVAIECALMKEARGGSHGRQRIIQYGLQKHAHKNIAHEV
ncbi:MAG: hypothetical protein AAFP93_00885, partial [Bacteroidota bacterium]